MLLLSAFLAAVTVASKTCLNEWARDATDTCQLFTELSDCKAKAAMCSPSDVVYIEDREGNLHAKMLAEQTFAALEAAALEATNADSLTISYSFTYGGRSISFDVANDADLKKAMSTQSDGVYMTDDQVYSDGWVKVGSLADWDDVVANYPPATWRYATLYNAGGSGVLHEVTPSSWNRGIRLMSENYMQNDNVAAFEMGVVVFYKGTTDASDWTQRYYQLKDGSYKQAWSNGSAVNVNLYVHKMQHPWVKVGTLSNYDAVISSHPLSRYRYGVRYNTVSGYVHNVALSGWNRGIRLTTEPYMMGDTGDSLDYGVTTFSRGTDGQAHTWEQQYYKLTSGSYDAFHSNGAVDTVELWVQLI